MRTSKPGATILAGNMPYYGLVVRVNHRKNAQLMDRKHIIVTVIGRDEVGIVARIATTLAETGVNIIDINQTILGGEIFAMTLLADRLKSELSLPEITGKLQESVAKMSLKVTVQDSEVFQYMHRV